MTEALVFVGTYSVGNVHQKGAGTGIHVLRLSPDGSLHEIASVAAANPNYIAVHPNGRVLYAVNEIDEYRGEKSGAVSTYSIGPGGELSLIGEQKTIGTIPCHVSLDAGGRTAFVSNYGTGSVVSYRVGSDGALGEPMGFAQHPGDKTHAHSVVLDPSNRFAYACELGGQSIWIYKPDLDRGVIFPIGTDLASSASVSADAARSVQLGGGGKRPVDPRHGAFSADGRFFYVVTEFGNQVLLFAVNQSDGSLSLVESVSTLPADFTETSYAADVMLSPDGRFLYATNRGHNSIAIFSVDQATGRLTVVGHEPCLGAWPRHFSFDRTGTLLLLANQKENSVLSFRVDRVSGRLTPTGHSASIGTPTCVVPF